MPTTHLSIVFNHRYDANLPRLDALYAGRFDDIRFLMPFYGGDRTDVIAVFEASSQFQGYFAQAHRELAKIDADFYAFAGDDLLLHPSLNQANLADELGLRAAGKADAGFIKAFNAASEQETHWHHTLPAMRAMSPGPFVNASGELPPPDDARQRIERHGVTLRPIGRGDALRRAWKSQRGLNKAAYAFFALRHMRHDAYPLLVGYSDFVVVPRAALAAFCRWCGVLAALRVWAEVATPTALAWACERIVTEAGTPWRGTEYWGQAALDAGLWSRVPPGTTDVSVLLAAYAPHELYVHPIKLSKFAAPAAAGGAAS